MGKDLYRQKEVKALKNCVAKILRKAKNLAYKGFLERYDIK